jgi:septal ring factor EnvC (AmiA/AmiB activator)
MDKFTILNLNGEAKYVAAIYDGSGNEIVTTYETIENVSANKAELLAEINTTNQLVETLTTRVVATEAFATSIETNAKDIQTHLSSIKALENKDSELQESLNTLTIGL